MAYKFKRQKLKVWELSFSDEGTTYTVPLVSSLPQPWVLRINRITTLPEDERGPAWIQFACDLFEEYLGDVAKTLTLEEVSTLFDAWNEANEEADGATPGE